MTGRSLRVFWPLVVGAFVSQGCGAKASSPLGEAEGVGQFCGGIAGLVCPGELYCVDDPRDDCDPAQGGADCGGVCVRASQRETFQQGLCAVEGRRHVTLDPQRCATVRFVCERGERAFFDACGCGCEPAG